MAGMKAAGLGNDNAIDNSQEGWDAGLEINWAITQAGNLDETTIMQKLQHLDINTLGILWTRTPSNYESYSAVRGRDGDHQLRRLGHSLQVAKSQTRLSRTDGVLRTVRSASRVYLPTVRFGVLRPGVTRGPAAPLYRPCGPRATTVYGPGATGPYSAGPVAPRAIRSGPAAPGASARPRTTATRAPDGGRRARSARRRGYHSRSDCQLAAEALVLGDLAAGGHQDQVAGDVRHPLAHRPLGLLPFPLGRRDGHVLAADGGQEAEHQQRRRQREQPRDQRRLADQPLWWPVRRYDRDHDREPPGRPPRARSAATATARRAATRPAAAAAGGGHAAHRAGQRLRHHRGVAAGRLAQAARPRHRERAADGVGERGDRVVYLGLLRLAGRLGRPAGLAGPGAGAALAGSPGSAGGGGAAGRRASRSAGPPAPRGRSPSPAPPRPRPPPR